MAQPKKDRPPVIKDVAARAGVSVPTVSRVINGGLHVSVDKRDRVMKAIAELQFRPSPQARALVERSPRLIAVFTSDTSKYGYAETIRGIEEGARAANKNVAIAVLESDDPASVTQTVEFTMGQPIAGVVVLNFDPAGLEAINHVPNGFPAVVISGPAQHRFSQAVIAEAHGAEEVVNYLLELGHRTVYHVRVPPPNGEHPRTTGWRQALERAGRVVPAIFEADWEPESGRLIGHDIAESSDITAVFCGNDEVAMGIMRGLSERGKSVPGDVSVVGYDDHPLAAMWVPSLTTVRQNFAALGAEAFDLLTREVAGDEVIRRSSLVAMPIIRESVAQPTALLKPPFAE